MAFKKGVLGKKRTYYYPLPKKCNCGTNKRTASPPLLTSELLCLITNMLICLDCKISKLNKMPFKKHVFGIGTTLCSKFSPSPPKQCSQTCHPSPGSNHKLITVNIRSLAQMPSDMTSVCPRSESFMTLQFIALLLPLVL